MNIQIKNIIVPTRFRNDKGDLTALADSIKSHGLLQPITVMESKDGYVLISGYRRLEAVKMVGGVEIAATVVSPLDAEKRLQLEIEENTVRKDFTPSERVAYAEKLKAIEQEKARQRQSEAAKYKSTPANAGRSNEAVAEKVGFSSGKQLDRAAFIAQNRPDLMEKVDAGERTITGAYEEAKGITRKQKSPEFRLEFGYAFVLNEVVNATDAFIEAISQAAEHYKQLKHTEMRGEFILRAIDEASQIAQDVFGTCLDD